MSDLPPDPSLADAEAILREMRRQIAAVKAQVEDHRETMRAAGLADTAPPADRRSRAGQPQS